jgi:hypothetical protein
MMAWRDSVRHFLMGAPYEEVAVVAQTKVLSPLVSVPLDAPEPAMAIEENTITALRRAEFLADAHVFSNADPAIQQASFRDRFVTQAPSVERREAARLQSEADAPVSPRPAPLLTSVAIDRAERLAERRSYQGFMPVARKAMA